MSKLIAIILSQDPNIRNKSLESICNSASLNELLLECNELEIFRHESKNLYEKVRALFFLYAIHRFHIPLKDGLSTRGLIPYSGYNHLLKRRFEEAIELFQANQKKDGPSDGLSSALSTAYHSLGFQTLANQVRRSVRSVSGNQWMFRIGHPADHPLRIHEKLTTSNNSTKLFPILHEATPVRMDLSHSGWSDIFFLGMDFPEGARVLNVSIDLSVRDSSGFKLPKPPIETFLRVIDQPVLRLVSLDLEASADITTIAEVFDFAKDYLGLLKAAVIASGIIPPGMEGAEQPLEDLLGRLIKPGYGIEIVSQVNGIPKGSRLAVSTNLLASLIAVCMRATGQTIALTGSLTEEERRLVAARAILGEWIGGSGGGWQDSGGVWPGIKLIQGVEAKNGDPEFNVSKGRLLPTHYILTQNEISENVRQKLQDSLVLVHGGMAQDVGPILEMVTEKYLLRSEVEWNGRKQAIKLFDDIVKNLKNGEISGIGKCTQSNFEGPIQAIIPWASNLFTETLIELVKKEFGKNFWGFWMLGGMSGGGMGFIFDPKKKKFAQERLQEILRLTKQQLQHAVPFGIEPVVYDFTINESGTKAVLLSEDEALMPPVYYTQSVPDLLRKERRDLSITKRNELNQFGIACRNKPELSGVVETLFDRLLPGSANQTSSDKNLQELLEEWGFDKIQHEQIRADLRSGRIGLSQNRLSVSSMIEDVNEDDVFDATRDLSKRQYDIGAEAIKRRKIAVVSLAGGAGSRWTKGAGVVKALNPFCKIGGKHRTFIETHLAKSQKVNETFNTIIPHIFTTSYLTYEPIKSYLKQVDNYSYSAPLILSPGRFVGLRMIPMMRDLIFAWEEMPHQLLDEQAQKVLESLHTALIEWANKMGEGNDYTDNLPLQCLHPVGHWYEIPNLMCNGVLLKLLADNPGLQYLMIHNIDTLGVNVEPAILGFHIESGAGITTEVITKRIEDRGGGLANIDGHTRLIEGLALPREEIEFKLSYYNTSTTWVEIDQLLSVFNLSRTDLTNNNKVMDSIRILSSRMPTYITIKDVKKRWGKGQEDIFPVAQFEKLWGDMTSLRELNSRFILVPRMRGQQLKEPAQLDGWLRDGSAAYLESLCKW
jgi:UDP-N-acetylglucosamine pyrophosphorylase